MNNLTNTNQNSDGAKLWARLDAVSVASDCYEALEAMRDLANAPEDARAVVAAQITAELDRLDANALDLRGDGVG